MEKYINTWQNSPEDVLRQDRQYLVIEEWREPNAQHIPPIHNHFFTEIEFIAEGSCVQKINGHTISCESGSIVLMFSRDVHEYVSFSENTHLYSLCFADDMLPRKLADALYAKNTALSAKLPSEISKDVQRCFAQLLQEKFQNKSFGAVFSKSLISEIVVQVLRHTNTAAFGIRNALLGEALKYMRENYTQGILETDVAKHIHVTPQYFSRLFKTELNISFQMYLRNMRLEHAIMLLRTTNLSVAHICLECGFNSFSNFTKIFKKRFGILPKDVRKKQVEFIS